MKRLLTYLSAIIIMMMVPIGAKAYTFYVEGTFNSWKKTDQLVTSPWEKTMTGAEWYSKCGNKTTCELLIHADTWYIKPASRKGNITVDGDQVDFSSANNVSGENGKFTFANDATINYTLHVSWTSDQNNCKVWVTSESVATTTATLSISGGSTFTATNTAAPFHFYIPEGSYTKGDNLTFTVKTVQGSTTTYYGNPTTFDEGPKTYNVTSSSSSNTCTYAVPSNATGTITVSLLENLTELVIAHQTSGGGGTSTGYYLIGDLNSFGRPYTDTAWETKNWTTYGAVNKVMQFHDNGNGTYSLRIPASRPSSDDSTWDKPVNEKGSGTSQFVIAPEAAFSGIEYSGDLFSVSNWKNWSGLTLNWNQVLRPQSNASLNNADIASGTMAAGGNNNWTVNNNGGSYTITINPTAGTFSVTNDNTTHVMYVITKQGGYWRNSYLTDVASDQNTAYNHRHGDNASTGELSEFPNLAGETVYIAHNWHEQGRNKNFTTNQHLNIFGAWNDNGDLAPVTWIKAKSGATAKSIFPTKGNYSTNIDPTTGRTDGVDGASQYSTVISSGNDPSTGNITGKTGDAALIDPDATLSPGTTTWDSYTLNEGKTLTVTLNNDATGYKYSYGAGTTPNTAGTSTTFGVLSYDGTNVKLGDDVVASGNTVTICIQGTDGTKNGTVHEYTYTFNQRVVSTIDFTPKGGLFINSAKITVTGGNPPYTYTVKDASDASGKVLSTGNFVLDEDYPDGNYRISTPGYLTVTDKDGNSTTSDVPFDFTYSTSENYMNYNNNATGSKIIQTGGGQGALNVFINKNDDLNTLWLYAYNKTLDTELKDQHKDQDEIDKQVRLTDAFPGNDMTNAPTITIDGIKYVHFTIPEDNLREGDNVAIIVSQGNTQAENWWTQTTEEGVEIARTSDPAFIYNVKNVPATKADDSWNYKGANQLYQIAADGSRTIFFTKPDSWTEPIYCHAEDPSKPYCYFVDTNSWGSNLRIWAWDDNNGDKNYTGGTWPGATMTQVGNNGASGDSKRYVYRWEYSGDETGKPNKVKFSNNGSSETGNFNFINGAIYNTSGLVKGNEEPTSDKMVLKEGNIYTFSVPVGSTKLYFYDANGNKTSVVTYSSDARNHYTWDGSSLISTPASYAVDTEEYNKFLSTPPTTTVVTQKYPNGEDYWRAAPGDLSIKLDPKWGITDGLAESSTLDWAGNKPKKVNANQVLTQTIQGLNAGKTYTVQAIVGGPGEGKKTVTLTLEGAETVEKTINLRNGGSENSADLSRQGSEITKTGRVEYIEPLNFEGMNKYDVTKAGGWAKVEATVKASQAGWLTIKLKGESDANGWFDLSQVTLLEDANTTHGFRTTASATAKSTREGESNTYDYRARDISRGWKKNNAYSFFDRGKNRNAVIFANKRTVIAMDPDELADVEQNAALKAIDRRHPFNVVGSDEDDSNVGTAKALYLTDMGYGDDAENDAENPVDYKIGDSTWDTYNSPNYRKSGYTFKPYLAFNAEDVILDRTPGVAEKKQTTIMLPFGITIEELKQYYGDAVQAWDYQSYNNTNRTITFTEEKNALTANKPYILTGAYGMLDSRGKGNGIKNVAAVVNTIHHTASDHSGFTGTYEYKLISRGDANETHYGYNPTTGKFQIAAKGGAALKPFRAYFTLPIPLDEQNAAPYFTVIFDDVSTGISTVEQAEVEDNNVYTISGMYVGKLGADKLHKGVYIVNGKKYVVK